MPKIYIILVNYNGFQDTVECIDSINRINYENYEVIIVDNASTQTPTEKQLMYLKEHAVYIESPENLGFSGGNNIGIRYALDHDADYVLLLNNDTVVTPDFLDELVQEYEKHEDAGCVIGRIHFFDEPDKVWYGGGTADFRNVTVKHDNWGKRAEKINDSDRNREVTFATGCLMLISRNIFEYIGLLREQYFLYCEDTDYCFRIMRNGFKIYYTKDALIYHKVSSSTGAFSKNTQYYMLRNHMMMIREFGDKKGAAYLHLLKQYSVAILKRRKNIKPVIWAVYDCICRKEGKNRHVF